MKDLFSLNGRIALVTGALLLSGLLCGLAGAYLSIAQGGGFVRDMTAGKGYLALAALIFGRWRPWPTLGACLLFALADAAQLRLQGVALSGIGEIPVQFVQMLPYALTVLLLADPFLVHRVGFQLSCAATLGIALLAQPIAARMPGPRSVRDAFAVSYETAAHRFTNLATHHLGIPVHFMRISRAGVCPTRRKRPKPISRASRKSRRITRCRCCRWESPR